MLSKLKLILTLLIVGFSVQTLGAPVSNTAFLWMLSPNSLLLALKEGQPWPKQSDLRISDSTGQRLEIERLDYHAGGIDIFLKKPFPTDKNIKASWWGKSHYAYPTTGYLNYHYHYKGDDLGVTFKGDKVQFKVWSPTAERVSVVIYGDDQKTIRTLAPMVRLQKGVWIAEIPKAENLGHLYHYQVTAFGKTEFALDPYAKSMGAQDPRGHQPVGKGAIIELPAYTEHTPINNIASSTDVILYEAHVRDFTIAEDSPAPHRLKGTYEGFKYVVPHIADTGFTHVQFQPLQNFYTVNETDRSYQGDSLPATQINYNWGYDSQSFFSPEGWFASNARDPMARVTETRAMIESVHKGNLGATLDVVYNHLYSEHSLKNVAPGTYLRRDHFGNVSGRTGAGPSIESRMVMSRKLIVDSLSFWKDFYKFDGFRFDLMGFLDHETMKAIRKKLGPKMLLYGEAWEFTDLPYHIATTKSNMPCEAMLSAFNDTARNAILGQHGGRGFVQGHRADNAKLRTGVIGAIKRHPQDGLIHRDGYHRFADQPFQSLNYFSIHDGHTAWDKINLNINAPVTERQRYLKQAFAILLTSQGRVIAHGGSEFGRSKPLAPNDPTSHRAHTSKEVNPDHGTHYLHENSYRSPDTTNAVSWTELQKHQEVQQYVKGLIQLRRHFPAFRMKSADNIRKGLTFIGNEAHLGPRPLPDGAGYKNFLDPRLTNLTIEFVNAPHHMAQHRFYLAGEVHAGSNKNPLNNPFWIHLNSSGKGAITLNRKQLEQLDLKAWSELGSLQFKLVKTPGAWDTPAGVYSPYGHNTITPESILVGNRVKIDLSVLDHQAGFNPANQSSVVAFRVNNTLESDRLSRLPDLGYEEFIVVYSNSSRELFLPIQNIGDPTKWQVLVDPHQSGVFPLGNTDAIMIKEGLIFPRNGVTVVGRKK